MSRRDPVDRVVDLAFGVPIALATFAREATRYALHAAADAVTTSEPQADSASKAGPKAATLDPPLDGYDAMEARQLIALLDQASPALLDVIEAYERQGRARRTVLVKIDTVRASALA